MRRDAPGWRADVLHDRHGAFADKRDGHRVGADAVAPDALTRAIEGLVAKEDASLYDAGPTRRWLKVKQKGWAVAEDWWAAADQRAPQHLT